MKKTISRTVAAFCVLFATVSFAQTQTPAPTLREELRLGLEAAKANDHAGYLAHIEKALELNTTAMNRPELMYHAARAAALGGRSVEAVRWLDRLWEDKVESLVIEYAETDPAFADARQTPEWAALMRKVETLELGTVELAPGLWMLDGAGCALLASIGDDGTLLVDSGYSRASKAIAAALRKHGGAAQPLKFVVNTHHHEDHVGGNLAFSRATIIAHPKTREEMTKEQRFIGDAVVAPRPRQALPTLLVDAPVTIHFNGDEIRLVPFPAHSPGDIAVIFRKANVVHLGDNYFPGVSTLLFPGKEIDAFFQAMRTIIRDLPDDARIVTGHAPVVPGSELKKIFAATEKLYEFVRAAIAAGKTLETVKSEGVAAGFKEDWLEHFYGTLKK